MDDDWIRERILNPELSLLTRDDKENNDLDTSRVF